MCRFTRMYKIQFSAFNPTIWYEFEHMHACNMLNGWADSHPQTVAYGRDVYISDYVHTFSTILFYFY